MFCHSVFLLLPMSVSLPFRSDTPYICRSVCLVLPMCIILYVCNSAWLFVRTYGHSGHRRSLRMSVTPYVWRLLYLSLRMSGVHSVCHLIFFLHSMLATAYANHSLCLPFRTFVPTYVMCPFLSMPVSLYIQIVVCPINCVFLPIRVSFNQCFSFRHSGRLSVYLSLVIDYWDFGLIAKTRQIWNFI